MGNTNWQLLIGHFQKEWKLDKCGYTHTIHWRWKLLHFNLQFHFNSLSKKDGYSLGLKTKCILRSWLSYWNGRRLNFWESAHTQAALWKPELSNEKLDWMGRSRCLPHFCIRSVNSIFHGYNHLKARLPASGLHYMVSSHCIRVVHICEGDEENGCNTYVEGCDSAGRVIRR